MAYEYHSTGQVYYLRALKVADLNILTSRLTFPSHRSQYMNSLQYPANYRLSVRKTSRDR